MFILKKLEHIHLEFNAYLNKVNINVISTGKIKYPLNILFVKDQAAVIEMADSDSDIFILKHK